MGHLWQGDPGSSWLTAPPQVTVLLAFWVNKHLSQQTLEDLSFWCLTPSGTSGTKIHNSFHVGGQFRGRCWLKTRPTMQRTSLFLFFYSWLFLSLQDQTILEGPTINRPQCVALKAADKRAETRWSEGTRSGSKIPTDQQKKKRSTTVHLLLQCPARNEDLSKLQRGVDGLPTPTSCPIKLSPRRPLLETSTNHQARATGITSTRA